MTVYLFANNAQTTLAGAITSTATTCNVASGTGVLFPSPGAGQLFVMTFIDAATGLLNEIVHVTNVTGDTLTIVRAQEGTTALNWSANDITAALVTAGCLEQMTQQGQDLGRQAGPPQVYTATQSGITLPSGTTAYKAQLIGGGGAGGPAAATGSGQGSCGSGAQGGGYCEAWVTVAAGAIDLVIGNGGTGYGTLSGFLTGDSGSATVLTFNSGSTLSAQGGGGGAGHLAAASAFPIFSGDGNVLGAGTGGYINVAGPQGNLAVASDDAGGGISGIGGCNPMFGGPGPTGNGCGGNGAQNAQLNGSVTAGSPGVSGLCILTPFII